MRDTLKTAVPALALLTVLAACGGPTDRPAAGASGGSSPAASTPSSGGTAPGNDASGPASAGATATKTSAKPVKGNACQVDRLQVTVAAQPSDNVKTQTAMVIVTNSGKQNCTAPGRFTIALVNAADESVDVPTKKVDQPGPASEVEIKAGGSAFAGIKWIPCAKSDATCGVGNTLRFALDDSAKGPAATLEGFPAAESSGITMKSLQVGTLQPSNQGVVAW